MSLLTFTVRESVVIERPIEDVFAFIVDAKNDVRWCPSVKEIELIEGDGSGEGARYHMLHTPGGREYNATVEFVEVERPRRIRWIMTDSGHELRGSYELEPVDGGTRLSQTSQITFAGWLRLPGLVLKGVIKKEVQKELDKQFANLKEILETTPTVSNNRQASVARRVSHDT